MTEPITLACIFWVTCAVASVIMTKYFLSRWI